MVGFGAGLGVPSWRPAFGWIWGGLAEAGWGRVDFGVPCEPTSTGRVRAGVPCEGGFTGHPGGGSRRKGTLGVGCDLASYSALFTAIAREDNWLLLLPEILCTK